MNVPAARMVFSDDDRAAVLSMIDEVLRTGSLTLGPHTRELEEAFRSRHDAPHAVAVSSGTSALEISLRALGVEDREVVVRCAPGQIGTTSVTTTEQLLARDGRVAAEAEVVIVARDPVTRRTRPLDMSERGALERELH